MALWRGLEPKQRLRFAKLAKSTEASLRQYAEGRRNISPDLAIRVEKAASRMQIIPIINRTDLSATCQSCEYARFAMKAKLT
jgi:DNA-binding transcriptional regulator YdaS (Cro superfamily)